MKTSSAEPIVNRACTAATPIADEGSHEAVAMLCVDADMTEARKGDDLILRIKDDCIPFDPVERRNIIDSEDKASNIGVKIVLGIASSVNYRHMLGLNVLTIRL